MKKIYLFLWSFSKIVIFFSNSLIFLWWLVIIVERCKMIAPKPSIEITKTPIALNSIPSKEDTKEIERQKSKR